MKMPANNINSDLGFQIAPLIDVVFVILVFFMALAGQIRLEQILMTKLPGISVASGSAEFVDEQILQIDDAGEVTLNDEAYDNIFSADLPQLTGTLMRLKQSSDAANTKVVVTLVSHPDSTYGRTINVLNALSLAGITNVTFTADEEF